MTVESISVCLPKGNPMKPLAAYLEQVSFPIREYHSKNRTYRPPVDNLPVRAKIMAEKDVAIQVSVGNYDIGFCGLDWTKELIDKYRGSNLHIFKHMGIDCRKLFVCTGLNSHLDSIAALYEYKGFITIISEYPNLSERFAIKNRLRKFKVFSAWGSVEAYPPEHGDVVILSSYEPDSLSEMGLAPISCELESQLCLLVNRTSFVEKNLSPVLDYFSDVNLAGEEK